MPWMLSKNIFKKYFWWTRHFCVTIDTPNLDFFGLLVTSPLGFKATVGSLICAWQRCMCYTFLIFTSGATPADLLLVVVKTRCLGIYQK